MEARAPMTSIERHAKDTMIPAIVALKDRYPDYLLECIDWSMDMDYKQRPQDAGELLSAIQNKRGRLKPKPVVKF